jgi:death-on-curing protein
VIAPIFLSVDDVVQLHEDVLAADGGAEGLRDRGLLESAVHAPQASFGGQWLVGDIFEMAATYMAHIAKNHAFVDGNKRTALLTSLVFLGLNGFELDHDDQRLDDAVLAVATGSLTREGAAQTLRAIAAEQS